MTAKLARVAVCLLVAACGGSSTDGDSAGAGGTSAAGASGGTSKGGAAGKSGAAGASASAGAAGKSGAAGASMGGTSGSAGAAGASAGNGGKGGNAAGSAGSSGASGASAGGASAGGSAGKGGASGAAGASTGGSAGSGGSGACANGATMPCGKCGVGTATCMSGVFGACVIPPAATTLSLTATLRDFKAFVKPDGSPNPGGHPDFENGNGAEQGIVQAALDANQKPIYAKDGQPSTTTHGKMYFDQWYNDVAGVNQSKTVTFDLSLVAGSTPPQYKYSNQDFFPIDNQLWGNEGYSHNYGFTVELHTKFRYMGGEKFDFTGDDDVFVFLANKLALDLGGVHGAESGTIDLDAMAGQLGMTTCNVYDFALFYNERHTTQSDLALTTTIGLTDKP